MEGKLTAHKFKIGESVDYIFAGRMARLAFMRSRSLCRSKTTNSSTASKAPTSPMNVWSKKANSIGQCDRRWHCNAVVLLFGIAPSARSSSVQAGR